MSERKGFPLATGVLDYFPDALMAVAAVSLAGARQHGTMAGDTPTWARGISTDHPDALLRHLKDRGRLDTDGHRHTAKVAWRALALLQEELELAAAQEAVEAKANAVQQRADELREDGAVTIPAFLTAARGEE